MKETMQIIVLINSIERADKLVRALLSINNAGQLNFGIHLLSTINTSPLDSDEICGIKIGTSNTNAEMLSHAADMLNNNSPCIICTDEVVPVSNWHIALENITTLHSDVDCIFGRRYTETLENKGQFENAELGFKYKDAMPETIAPHVIDFAPSPHSNCIEVGSFPIFFNWFSHNMSVVLKNALRKADSLESFQTELALGQASENGKALTFYYAPELETVDHTLLELFNT
jgi:hypothetical protein